MEKWEFGCWFSTWIWSVFELVSPRWKGCADRIDSVFFPKHRVKLYFHMSPKLLDLDRSISFDTPKRPRGEPEDLISITMFIYEVV